ncbi:fungal hydrophobin [Schizophyllum commune H4-8]|uniref:Hydrophobin n=1 Tax=Schizophyllum commune (strain H4-8 / FGSC 9210) TaxID=578458 RepID=D8PTH5_SCHCM|nr:fungal hydrophobin [Schizophyllum commune H4-8]KAI5899294.1 fungal hydrophobin [Schizophyllum commune H4-8]
MRFTIALFAALPLLVAASAVPRAPGGQKCRAESVQCCNTTYSHKDYSHVEYLQGLGISPEVLANPDASSYADCTPLSVVGGHGCQASSTAVCCENNYQRGAVNMGCVPISMAA